MKSIRPFNPDRVPSPSPADFAYMEQFDWHSQPVDLELGCGTGMHPLLYAKDNPNRKLIAIEQTKNKFNVFKKDHENSDLKNLFPIRADATHWVPKFIPDHSIESCFILYPNPYPKAKQENLRWHYMPFFHCLLTKLKEDSQIIVATNLEWLANETAEQMQNFWQLHLEKFERLDNSFSPRTLFEKKYLEREQTCFNLTFRLKHPT